MRMYGLIGYPLAHSFSAEWFSQQFREKGIANTAYENFPISDIKELPSLLHMDSLWGFNVTAPYKTSVLKYLDEVDDTATRIGAVNCAVREGESWKGYNTDWQAFKISLQEFLGAERPKALILGSGGAARAAAYALSTLAIPHLIASRQVKEEGFISYGELSAAVMDEYRVIVNATPLGTYPATVQCPPIPYGLLTSDHMLYDMVYNPPLSEFLRRGKARGARVTNGSRMLHLQAEGSWKLFGIEKHPDSIL